MECPRLPAGRFSGTSLSDFVRLPRQLSWTFLTRRTPIQARHPDDTLAEQFASASPEEQKRIADQIAKLPGAKAPRILLWVGVTMALVLLGLINRLILIDLAYLKPDMGALVLIDSFGLVGIAKSIMFYYVSKPSVYNMLAEYKNRNGRLPSGIG